MQRPGDAKSAVVLLASVRFWPLLASWAQRAQNKPYQGPHATIELAILGESMIQCNAQIEIFAPAEVVFAVLWDVESYPDFLTDIVDAQIDTTPEPFVQDCTFRVTFIRSRTYSLQMRGQPGRRLSWTLLDGENMLTNEGQWQLRPTADERSCHVSYELNLDLAVVLAQAVLKK